MRVPLLRDDPARAYNRTRDEIRTRGAIFNINEGLDVDNGKGCITRLIGWPAIGTRMVSFHLLIHKPGGKFDTQIRPISEVSMTCIRGAGEVNLGDAGWEQIEGGNVIFVPMGVPFATRCAPALVKHGTGNHKNAPGPINSSGCASPPQFDLYEKAGYLKNGKFVDFPVE